MYFCLLLAIDSQTRADLVSGSVSLGVQAADGSVTWEYFRVNTLPLDRVNRRRRRRKVKRTSFKVDILLCIVHSTSTVARKKMTKTN